MKFNLLSTSGKYRASLLLLAVGSVLPLLFRGPSCGHDFDFHLQSWLGVLADWHSGVPVPHWVAGANYGAGEPRFLFYPPLSWLLGAALGAVLPWSLVPAAFTAVCLAGAAFGMYRLATRLCSPPASMLAAAFYAASPYLLFTAYERTAYGELLAAAFLPLLLAALLRPVLPVPQAALSLAALWYANAPAGVIGCYLLLLGFAWRVALRRAPLLKESLRHGAALLLGCGLAADYLLPAWYEQRFVAIQRAVGPGMRIEDSFLFGHTGEPFHDQVLHTASLVAVSTLGTGLLAAGVALWRARRNRTDRLALSPHDTSAPALGFLTLLLGACLLLQLPFTGPLWDALPELGFLQFPWRLLLPASAAAALLLAFALGSLAKRSWVALGTALLFIAGLTTWAGTTRYQPCDDEDNVRAQVALFHAGTGFEGTDEYAPAGSDNGEIQQRLPPVRLLRAPSADKGDDTNTPNPPWKPGPSATVPGTVRVQTWSGEQLAVQVHPEADAWAVLRSERFPARQILLDGQPCGLACVPREDGLIAVHVPGGRPSTIEVRPVTTADVWWGRALTTFALLLLLAQRPRHAMRLRKLS